jgi:hypothetical protein
VFEPFKISSNAHFYTFQSVLLNVHWGEMRLQTFLEISGVCESMVRMHNVYSSIIVVRGDYGVELSSEVRAAAAQLTLKYQKHTRAQALVLEADGFKSSIARSVITAVNLLARSDIKTRVFKDPVQAVQWLCALEEQPAAIHSAAPRLAEAIRKLLADLPQ